LNVLKSLNGSAAMLIISTEFLLVKFVNTVMDVYDVCISV